MPEPLGIGVDWTLVNEDVTAWARKYSAKVAKEITETSHKGLGSQIAAWVESGDSLPGLFKRLEPIYGKKRAELIGITEATRAYARGNEVLWQKSGVVEGKQWSTANDERVCFPAWTMVAATRGDMPIQRIRPGNCVRTRGGLYFVTATMTRVYRGRMVQILTRRGWLTCTANHPIWSVGESDWIEAQRLREGQLLESNDGEDTEVLQVLLASVSGEVVYNLEIEDVPEFYANGLLVHNCPICGPLGGLTMTDEGADPASVDEQIARGVQANLGDKFVHPGTGMVFDPPAHPRCRCAILPIVIRREEVAPVEERVRPTGGVAPVGEDVTTEVIDKWLSELTPWWRVAGEERAIAKEQIVTELSKRSGISEVEVNAFIKQWAFSSNDDDMRSLSLQKAASELFDVPMSEFTQGKIKSLEDWWDKMRPEGQAIWLEKSKTGKSQFHSLLSDGDQRALLQSMYDNTQEQLKAAGFEPGDTVRLRRGVKLSRYAQVGAEGDTVSIVGNPLESWSVGVSTAESFAKDLTRNQVGVVFEMDVPVETVASSARTGFGCLTEGEFLVMGSTPGSLAKIIRKFTY